MKPVEYSKLNDLQHRIDEIQNKLVEIGHEACNLLPESNCTFYAKVTVINAIQAFRTAIQDANRARGVG